MKKIVLTLALFIPFLIQAQTGFEAEELVVDTTFDESTSDPVGKGKICNTGSDTIVLYWRIEENMVPFGWTPFFCDKNLCYGPGTTECPESEPVVLAPDECGVMDLHLLPGASPECGKYDVVVWEKDNPSNNLTILYTFNCMTSSTDFATVENINVFPNPTTEFFQLSETEGVSRVSLHNLLGKHVRDYRVVDNGRYNVTDLKNGLYVVNLFDDRNKIVRSVRLTKK